MGHMRKAMVGLTAVIAMACSLVFVGVVYQLIANPPEIQFTKLTKECVQWHGLGCTWEIRIRDGEMEQISMRPWPLLRSLI